MTLPDVGVRKAPHRLRATCNRCTCELTARMRFHVEAKGGELRTRRQTKLGENDEKIWESDWNWVWVNSMKSRPNRPPFVNSDRLVSASISRTAFDKYSTKDTWMSVTGRAVDYDRDRAYRSNRFENG